MRGHIFAGLLALSALAILYFAFQFVPLLQNLEPIEKTTKPYKDSKANQRGTEKVPLVVKILPTEEDGAKAEAERGEKHEKAVNEHTLVWATIALSVFTFALACFTAYLWSSTSDLVEKTEASTKK